MSLKLFLLMFENMLKKLQKKNPTITEEVLLGRIVEAWGEAKAKV